MIDQGTDAKGTTMADRDGLKFVGFIFATVTLAAMPPTATTKLAFTHGGYSLEPAAIAGR